MDTLNNRLFDSIFATENEVNKTNEPQMAYKDSYFSLIDKKKEEPYYQIIETSLSRTSNEERFRYREILNLTE